METEIWKDVPGWEEKYMASNLGRIKSLGRWVNHIKRQKFNSGKMMSLCVDNKGYISLSFTRNGKTTLVKAHKIIAITFIPNPENKATINHINEIKTDNRVVNLEWATHAENIRAYRANHPDAMNSKRIFSDEDILAMFVMRHEMNCTLEKIANHFSAKSSSTICAILKRKIYRNIEIPEKYLPAI